MSAANDMDRPSTGLIRRRGTAPPGWRTLLYWLVAVTVIVTVTGIVLDRATRLVPLLVVLPSLIAGRGTVRQTVFASVWVTLVILGSLLTGPWDTVWTHVALMLFAIVFNGLSVAGAAQRVRGEAEIARLRSAAAALQRHILRPFPLVTDELLVYGLYEPVEEDSKVGGDLYEVVISPYGSRVLIADVQGKGLPALSAAFAVLSSFREAALTEPTLTRVVDALEETVVRHNSFAAQTGESERFVTALVLDVGSGQKVQAINCGHIPPYLMHGERTGPALRDEPAVPLGFGSLALDPRTVEWFEFPYDATLLLCTDGVTEARDASGDFYPLEERLAAWDQVRPSDIVTTVLSELQQHTGGSQSDDALVLVLRRRSAAAAVANERS